MKSRETRQSACATRGQCVPDGSSTGPSLDGFREVDLTLSVFAPPWQRSRPEQRDTGQISVLQCLKCARKENWGRAAAEFVKRTFQCYSAVDTEEDIEADASLRRLERFSQLPRKLALGSD